MAAWPPTPGTQEPRPWAANRQCDWLAAAQARLNPVIPGVRRSSGGHAVVSTEARLNPPVVPGARRSSGGHAVVSTEARLNPPVVPGARRSSGGHALTEARLNPVVATARRSSRTHAVASTEVPVASSPLTSRSLQSPCAVERLSERRSTTLRRKRSSAGSSETACVLACGRGGVEELRKQIDEHTVAWALLRFQVGGGTFVRTKMVLIHCNGVATPVMQRGLLNARSHEVLHHLGEVHASIEVTSSKELTLEYLCERLLRLFACDDMDYSLQALRQEYTNMVAQTEEAARKRAEEEATPQALEEPQSRQEQVRSGPDLSADEALQSVSADGGAFNWLLLEPSRALFKAGQGGLEEMKEQLADERVLFGVLRLTFGRAQGANGGRPAHGITKHVFVHWAGPRTSIVRRGIWNAKAGEVAAFVGKACSITFRREAQSLKDLQLDDIIMECRRLSVIDNVAAANGVAASRISVEEYRIAMAEEARERQAADERARKQKRQLELQRAEEEQRQWNVEPLELNEEQAPEAEDTKVALPDLATAVGAVRDPAGGWNWVLCGWPQAEAALLPPSPCRAIRS
eukprot:TRINITY_DN6389_c0_g1_i2.p1 TRINITY_DN6389_c0_g1~~TRINITY_DN6389_c0_g1_i2.p1  ORF type:complete len:575 (+),score=113.47 TRINITY_DN6389_c0_g1_i2:36-1760(+)